MKRLFLILMLAGATAGAMAQRVLSLDSCRAMALRGNKQLAVARLSRQMTDDVRRAARTEYLPKVDAMGGYVYTSREVSILNKDQKAALSSAGTTVGQQLQASGLGGQLAQAMTQLGLDPQLLATLPGALDQVGQGVVDAFRTDTRSMWAGSVAVRQPIYMGGAIRAANKMADISQQMAGTQEEQQRQEVLYDTDRAYWLVVSLRQKQRLAHSFRQLVGHLDDDVHRMIAEGVATRADGLKVDVRLNEADMSITEVENGLALARMLLCQLCGMPLDSQFTLEDEPRESEDASAEAPDLSPLTSGLSPAEAETSALQRPELRLLSSAVDLGKQNEKLVRALYLPHVAAVGGYAFSNPNVFNGFEKKVGGFWNVGVMVQMPVWNWLEGKYKVRAARTATAMARMELDEVREKVDLQVAQSRFKVDEAGKRLTRARKNIESAEENLRCADAGFREGVMDATAVMEAQTAWQQARSQMIDAEIDVRMTRTSLLKALGTLGLGE